MSKLDNLHKKKQDLIEEWMKIQEIIEGYNEQSYKISVEIEHVNMEIKQEEDKFSSRAAGDKRNGGNTRK